MHKKQIRKKAKLGYCKITSHDCLHPFHPTYSNANMSSLNHANIIGTITNTKCNFPSTFLDQSCYLLGTIG